MSDIKWSVSSTCTDSSPTVTIYLKLSLLIMFLNAFEATHIDTPEHLDAKTSGSYDLEKQLSSYMQVHKLAQSNNVTCNDGSQIGYYRRLNSHSKSWIIYLQGGGFCGSEQSCKQRWQQTPHLMSSNFWPKTKTVDGILSSNPKDNPYLWNANQIYVPYCSSDSWTGLSSSSGDQQGSFAFKGSKIIEQVIESLYEDLPRDSSLHGAKFVLLAGDSAGATGVILNLDRVNDMIQVKANSQRAACLASSQANQHTVCESKQAPVLRGLADSGWFLDNEPFSFGQPGSFAYMDTNGGSNQNMDVIDCDRNQCTPLQSIRQAMQLWNGQVPKECQIRYQTEPWRCYFGYRAYKTLKTPLFVVQWLYDEAQLMVDNIARPGTNEQWNYVNKVFNEMRASLENVTALFAPSCFSHSLIVRRSWNQININGFKLPHILNSWEEQSLIDTTEFAIASHSNGQSLGKPDDSTRTFQTTNSPQQQLTGGLLSHINNTATVPLLASQPTFETILIEQESPQQNLAPTNFRESPDSRPHQDMRNFNPRGVSVGTNQNKNRNRKRKRNNQHQKSRQARFRTSQSQDVNLVPTVTESSQQPILPRDSSNDLAASPDSPMQDFLPIVDRPLTSGDLIFGRLSRESSAGSANGRLGRSTIIDDTTLMVGNSVPDENSASQTTLVDNRAELRWNWHPSDTRARVASFVPPATSSPSGSDRFRYMDTCGWPQCNRDCPVMSSDFTSGSLIRF